VKGIYIWCIMISIPLSKVMCLWISKPWPIEFMKAQIFIELLFEHRTKSFSIWVCWATYLGHICRLDGGIWFCYNTCICKSDDIYEKTMWRSSWSIHYIIAKPICSPKLAHNISYNQSLKQSVLFVW
jgi:hypothetical protein